MTAGRADTDRVTPRPRHALEPVRRTRVATRTAALLSVLALLAAASLGSRSTGALVGEELAAAAQPALARPAVQTAPARPAPRPALLLGPSGQRALAGARVAGRVQVRVTTSTTGWRVRSVQWYLDVPPVRHRPVSIAVKAPWYLVTSLGAHRIAALDTARLRAGRHVLTARLVMAGGVTRTLAAAFTVVHPVAGPAVARLLFGIGPEADGARAVALNSAARLGMYTSWYNGPSDLAWMRLWRTSLVPRAYADRRAMHLVVYDPSAVGTIQTRYGTACGRPYSLSSGFLTDMASLADIFAGKAGGPPLYVTMFTEVQTYACVGNAWASNSSATHYYEALKDQYRAAMAVFHQHAPNAKVSLGWGGWAARTNNPATGGGLAMIPHFADVLRASDFQSFQAMQSDTNVTDIATMTRVLGAYGPVMLAHWKPDNGSQQTFAADVRAVLTDASLRSLRSAGLFAVSFMDQTTMPTGGTTFNLVAAAVRRHES